MVTRENNNKNIVIGVTGFYNIVTRYGTGYANSTFGSNSYEAQLKINGAVVAKNRFVYSCR